MILKLYQGFFVYGTQQNFASHNCKISVVIFVLFISIEVRHSLQVILCTKEVGSKAKGAAFDLIKEIGTALVFLSDKPKEGKYRVVVTIFLSIVLFSLGNQQVHCMYQHLHEVYSLYLSYKLNTCLEINPLHLRTCSRMHRGILHDSHGWSGWISTYDQRDVVGVYKDDI